ncbi:hypothetical protein CAPTEDRAFT_180718 [Capitella teleta]|uniref:Riboflavin transporter n=1 Tax=Capitella teleta TaxID=283909 RepID=R7VEK9_CAPTE|nr:hypothetical protein CAPTEDRAFT_180718 [Capitella teleta]|eukprot:ELU14110.1 hypothetical protein CAPTEDRAFT_180718 [Capitella teleta]
MEQTKQWVSQINIPVYFIVMFFAISSWIDINGLWVEVPLLINDLPEGWNIPSYLVIIIQVANIGPLCYTVANRVWPHRVKEWPVVYAIICIGGASCIFMTFFWQVTTVVGGQLHSTVLFILTTCLSVVDCTSSVVYLPYMAGFKPQYMTAFYIGEGLSWLIPGLVGLVQGVSNEGKCVNVSIPIYNASTGENYTIYEQQLVTDPPLFSVEVFFYFLFAMLILSAVCFTLLHFTSFCRHERIDTNHLQLADQSEHPQNPSFASKPERMLSRDYDGIDFSKRHLTNFEFSLLLLLCAWVNGLTSGVIPSTQSYTCLPYGNRAYNLAVRLSTLVNPLGCFVALFAAANSVVVISSLTGVASGMAAVQLYLASTSPSPPLQGEPSGEVMVILLSVVFSFCISYIKVVIATTVLASGGRRGLLWVGVVTQVGSLIAAIITFVCVSVVGVFTAMPPSTC